MPAGAVSVTLFPWQNVVGPPAVMTTTGGASRARVFGAASKVHPLGVSTCRWTSIGPSVDWNWAQPALAVTSVAPVADQRYAWFGKSGDAVATNVPRAQTDAGAEMVNVCVVF